MSLPDSLVFSSNEEHVAPSIMVWTSQYFEVDLPPRPAVMVGAHLLLPATACRHGQP